MSDRSCSTNQRAQQPQHLSSSAPRYIAEAPRQFIERTRSATSATLDALAGALAALGPAALPEGFWVVRGQEQILAHARSLIARAQREIAVRVGPAYSSPLAEALAQARERGCRVAQPPIEPREDAATVLLVIDDREALVGTLAPAERAQAVSGANPGFVTVLVRYFAPQQVFTSLRTTELAVASKETPLAWLDWEQRKQRDLLNEG